MHKQAAKRQNVGMPALNIPAFNHLDYDEYYVDDDDQQILPPTIMDEGFDAPCITP